jgi:hypothetical protein
MREKVKRVTMRSMRKTRKEGGKGLDAETSVFGGFLARGEVGVAPVEGEGRVSCGNRRREEEKGAHLWA